MVCDNESIQTLFTQPKNVHHIFPIPMIRLSEIKPIGFVHVRKVFAKRSRIFYNQKQIQRQRSENKKDET